MAQTAAKAATPSLADKLSARLPDESYITTLGRNRQTGFINDPYRVGNLPAGFIATAVAKGAALAGAFGDGWIPFEPEQVTNKTYETDKAFIPNYDVSGGFVVVGYGVHEMVMCYANERIIASRREARKAAWNEQLSALSGKSEAAGARVRDYENNPAMGGLTSSGGHTYAVSHQGGGVTAQLNEHPDELFNRTKQQEA